jgi:hypothetical protein
VTTDELKKYLDEKYSIGAISFETDAQVRHDIRMRDAEIRDLRAALDLANARIAGYEAAYGVVKGQRDTFAVEARMETWEWDALKAAEEVEGRG